MDSRAGVPDALPTPSHACQWPTSTKKNRPEAVVIVEVTGVEPVTP
jgi:hypothetical protein